MPTTKKLASTVFALAASLALPFSAHAAFSSVDNFEAYDSSGQLSAAWPATLGAPVVTLESGSVCEGAKAMAFTYSGAATPFTNLVKLTFPSNQDWTSNTVLSFSYSGNGNANDDLLVELLDQSGTVLDSRRIAGGAAAEACSQASFDISGITGLQSVRSLQIGVIAADAANTGTVYFDNFQVGNRGVLSILGSSLALGVGSSGDTLHQYVNGGSLSNGYAARLMMTQGTNGWRVVNQSIGGDTTAKVISRFNRDEVPVHADEVQIGLSLGNEGLPGAANPKAVFDQFYNGTTNLIAMSRANGILPLIGNQYPRNAYTPTEYAWLKKMDLLLNTLDVPSANFLGATDDGSGHWVNNSFINLGTSDGIHPNDAGYYEMFLTIVPSVFDALKQGKPTPHFDGKERFLRITGDETQPAPLSFTPSLEVHSFTASFRVRSLKTGTVASITSESPAARPTVEITADDLAYVSANGTVNHSGVSGTNGAWHDVVVAHSWARGVTWFYVDGVLAATVSERLSPVKFVLGGPGDAAARPASPEQADYENWLVHRSMMNAEEVSAQFQGQFQQASLEVFAPLDDEVFVQNGSATNRAQSLSVAAIQAASGNLESVPAAESPANLLLSTNDAPTVILNWTDPAGAEQEEYYVERSTANGAWANVATLPAHTATYTDSSVGRGTNYQYRVSYSAAGWRSDYALSEVVQFARTNLPVVFIDFGPNDVANGKITSSPDANGNYWNNLVNTGNGSTVADLVTSDNGPTTIAVKLTSGSWAANGIQNGGLLNPDPALLGEFAVATATEDYFYINQNFGSANARQTMLISGLNPGLAYNLSIFATRNNAGTRTTTYSVTDGNGTHSTNLVTSGAAANSGTNPSNTAGNDKTIVTLSNLAPDRLGQLTLAVQIGDAANFAYIGAMKITATNLPPVFGLSPASQTLRAGTSNVLESFAQSTDPVQYQWYFANEPMADQTNATLILPHVLYQNAGDYYVVAANALGMATSAVAVVTVVPPAVPSNAVLIDFGPNDGANGVITSSPDFTGKYWNNLTSGSTVPNGLSLANMVTADNSPTAIDVTITSGGWANNGIQNGGLLAPNSSLLGDFAVATATEDYFFVQGANGTTGTLRLDGLDPAAVYDLSFFATRNAADTRISRYTVTDASGPRTIDLQTTGEGAGSLSQPNGNDDTIVSLTGLKPNGSGQLTLALSIVTGGFAYLGAMEISTGGNPSANSNFLPPGQIEGGWHFQFSATPGYAYRAERATDLNGPWFDLGPVSPGANGLFEFNDTDAPAEQAFYRIVAN